MPTRSIALLTLAAGLSACTYNGVVLTHEDSRPTYVAGIFAYAAAGRDLRVDIAGNPFDMTGSALAEAVTRAMQGHHWGPATNFTARPGPSARESYRVVMRFQPPLDQTSNSLCRGESSAVEPPSDAGEEIAVFAAFCRDSVPLTQIKGTIPGAAGPTDPLFADLIGQVTFALFPPRRRIERSDDRCPPWMIC